MLFSSYLNSKNVFHFYGKKEMCTSVVTRCPQNVYNCNSFNNLSNYSFYIKCMILKWKRWGSCGLIYNTELSAREIWGKPCHPVNSPTAERDSNPGLQNTTQEVQTSSYEHENCNFHTKQFYLYHFLEPTDHKTQITGTWSMCRPFTEPNISSEVYSR